MFPKRMWLFIPLLCSTLTWSQSTPNQPNSTAVLDVFGGYLYGGGDADQAGSGFLAGVDVDRIFKGIGFTGEFGYTKASSPPSPVDPISQFNVLAGPRFAFPVSSSSRLVPFFDVLVGTNTLHNSGQEYTYRYSNHTSFAWTVDGGLDIPLSRHIALRAQGGYLGTSLQGTTYTGPSPGNNAGRLRVSAGAVLRF